MKRRLKKFLLKFKPVKYYIKGKNFFKDPNVLENQRKNQIEILKSPKRTEIINYLLSFSEENSYYLEIGVRNPAHNFNHIKAANKFSVDPGLEYEENPVDFKMTSDIFFSKITNGEILTEEIRFDVIFIDGLHLASQVDRDIINSLKFIKEKGFIVLHDCNPPSEWHSRELFNYWITPAQEFWNGTTWKAFLKWRCNPLVHSCCIDSDWGVGILSKKAEIGKHSELNNEFYEFHTFNKNRKKSLNLIDFTTFKKYLSN